jgi:hypothetical protein
MKTWRVSPFLSISQGMILHKKHQTSTANWWFRLIRLLNTRATLPWAMEDLDGFYDQQPIRKAIRKPADRCATSRHHGASGGSQWFFPGRGTWPRTWVPWMELTSPPRSCNCSVLWPRWRSHCLPGMASWLGNQWGCSRPGKRLHNGKIHHRNSGFSHEQMVIFHSYVNVYQRVSWWFHEDFGMVYGYKRFVVRRYGLSLFFFWWLNLPRFVGTHVVYLQGLTRKRYCIHNLNIASVCWTHRNWAALGWWVLIWSWDEEP